MKSSNVFSLVAKLFSPKPAPEPAPKPAPVEKEEPRKLAYSSAPSGPDIPRSERGNSQTV